jgi:hypothetical protein
LVSPGIEPETSGSVARNSDLQTTVAVLTVIMRVKKYGREVRKQNGGFSKSYFPENGSLWTAASPDVQFILHKI